MNIKAGTRQQKSKTCRNASSTVWTSYIKSDQVSVGGFDLLILTLRPSSATDALWGFLEAWRELEKGFDMERSNQTSPGSFSWCQKVADTCTAHYPFWGCCDCWCCNRQKKRSCRPEEWDSWSSKSSRLEAQFSLIILEHYRSIYIIYPVIFRNILSKSMR